MFIYLSVTLMLPKEKNTLANSVEKHWEVWEKILYQHHFKMATQGWTAKSGHATPLLRLQTMT